MKIKTKLQLNAVLPLVLVLLIGLVLVFASRYVGAVTERGRTASAIVKEVFELTIMTDEYLMGHSERAQVQWGATYDSLNGLLKSLTVHTPAERAILDRIRQEHQGIKTTFSDLIDNHAQEAALAQTLAQPTTPSRARSKTEQARLRAEHDRATKELDILKELRARLVGQLLAKSQAMVSGGLQLAGMSQVQVARAERDTAFAIMGFTALLGMFIVMTSFLINRSVLRPMAKVQAGAATVAAGNVDHRIGIRTHDEIGDLSRTFDAMMDHLRDTTASRDELNRANEELKNSTTQLIQAEKMASIGQMVAGVAHEINTPLAYVRSSVEIVRDGMPQAAELMTAYAELVRMLTEDADEQALARRFETVTGLASRFAEAHSLDESTTLLTRGIHGLDQIRELVMNLKNFSRLDREKVTAFDLNAGIDSVLMLAKPVLKTRVHVVKQFGELLPVTCSPSQVNQVLLNVITNAAQAIEGDGGTITIETRQEGDRAKVSIHDTGKGVPPDVLPKIFDPFFTTKKVGEGTGLGLSIARKIMEEHRGTIRMDSTVGKGSTVTITLPTHAEFDQRIRA